MVRTRLFKAVLFGFSLLFSWLAAHRLAEWYFFDKLFYYKSTIHGYWVSGKKLALENFGERSKDLVSLLQISSGGKSDILGAKVGNKHGVFTVAVVGDSYAWGQGVRFEKTVSQILERRLNSRRASEVLLFATTGYSILDYLSVYQKARVFYGDGVDLFVFLLAANDSLLRFDSVFPDDDVDGIVSECSDRYPENLPVLDRWVESLSAGESGKEAYGRLMKGAWENMINRCIVAESVARLPKNAIYFITDNYWGNYELWDTYRSFLVKRGLHIISSELARNIETYAAYWKEPYERFYVSRTDRHPSAVAHRMYADVLYEEISANPEWGFNNTY